MGHRSVRSEMCDCRDKRKVGREGSHIPPLKAQSAWLLCRERRCGPLFSPILSCESIFIILHIMRLHTHRLAHGHFSEEDTQKNKYWGKKEQRWRSVGHCPPAWRVTTWSHHLSSRRGAYGPAKIESVPKEWRDKTKFTIVPNRLVRSMLVVRNILPHLSDRNKNVRVEGMASFIWSLTQFSIPWSWSISQPMMN